MTHDNHVVAEKNILFSNVVELLETTYNDNSTERTLVVIVTDDERVCVDIVRHRPCSIVGTRQTKRFLVST